MKFFSRVGMDIVNAAVAVKNAILKAAHDEPEINDFVQKYGAEFANLAGPLSPLAAAIIKDAMLVSGAIANLIDKGGAAVEQNLLSQGIDQEAINAAKSFISTVKSVAGPKPAAAA